MNLNGILPSSASDQGTGSSSSSGGGGGGSLDAVGQTSANIDSASALLNVELSDQNQEDAIGQVSGIIDIKSAAANGDNLSMSSEMDGMKPMGLCAICGDRGSGFHYSVYSCEGCKGFFKRTVQKDLQYKCREYQACPINKETRNQVCPAPVVQAMSALGSFVVVLSASFVDSNGASLLE